MRFLKSPEHACVWPLGWKGRSQRGIVSAVIISAVTGTILGRTEFKGVIYVCVCMHIKIYTGVLYIYIHKY